MTREIDLLEPRVLKLWRKAWKPLAWSMGVTTAVAGLLYGGFAAGEYYAPPQPKRVHIEAQIKTSTTTYYDHITGQRWMVTESYQRVPLTNSKEIKKKRAPAKPRFIEGYEL